MAPLCLCGCRRQTNMITKGDKKREIVAGGYRKYASHGCYLKHRKTNKVTRCPLGHKYLVTVGARNRCRLCGAARRLARKTGKSFTQCLVDIGYPPERCPICRKKDTGMGYRQLVPDHNHETNEFRGWLCGSCNKALGLLQDSPEIILNLRNYLVGSHWGEAQELSEWEVHNYDDIPF